MTTRISTSLSACGVPWAYEPNRTILIRVKALGDLACESADHAHRNVCPTIPLGWLRCARRSAFEPHATILAGCWNLSDTPPKLILAQEGEMDILAIALRSTWAQIRKLLESEKHRIS